MFKRRQYSHCDRGHWKKNAKFEDHVKECEAAATEEEEKIWKAREYMEELEKKAKPVLPPGTLFKKWKPKK